MRRILAGMIVLSILCMMGAVPALADGVSAQITLGDEAQTANALLAAEAIDGVTLSYGESFSFNSVVGERSQARGYVSALNGRGVEVVGGGSAQAASALYLALCRLDEGLVCFDELAFYGDRYVGNYVEDGSQAIMVDYSANRDFRFTSYYYGVMTLSFAQDGQTLTCQVTLEDDGVEFLGEEMEAAKLMPAHGSGTVEVTLSCQAGDAELNNIALAADSIYDLTLATGDEFSFNDVIGPLEEQYGFCEGVNGRGEIVMGGGVDQVASALWLLVNELDNISIIEKTTYGSAYVSDYVSGSADAIMVDPDADIDFAFRYNGEGYLTLYLYLDNTTLHAAADSVR